MKHLDSTDKAILELLQQDCKKTNKEMSESLNLSVTAVYERIKRLERKGYIQKYVAIVDKSLLEKGFVVYCQIKLSQHVKEFLMTFEKEIVKFDEVLECYHVSGEYDYLLKICVKDMEAYREFMVSKLTSLHHIGSTQSSFSINQVKHETAIKN